MFIFFRAWRGEDKNFPLTYLTSVGEYFFIILTHVFFSKILFSSYFLTGPVWKYEEWKYERKKYIKKNNYCETVSEAMKTKILKWIIVVFQE